MSLLIDGYNLLHATDLFGAGELAGTLQGSREALLAFLASQLTSKERRLTTIVFDAAGAPPGLPDRLKFEGIAVRYARGYPDADSLLEELLEHWRGPKGLTVVSSDHRVQRAARRQGAKYVDSQTWHAQIRGRRLASAPADRPGPSTTAEDANYWVKKFADDALQSEIEQQDERLKPKRPTQPPNPVSEKAKSQQPFGEGILDPFPEGYADDLAQQLDPSSDNKDELPE